MEKKQNYDSFIVYIKTEDIYIDIAKDVEIRFDTSCYELQRALNRGKKYGKFAALKPKSYSCFNRW